MDEQIELLILASDGLWDVVQNDVSCLTRAFYLFCAYLMRHSY